MKLLAWDTSSKSGALAALEWDPSSDKSPRLAAEWTLSVDAGGHSDRLLWGIHELLESAHWKIQDIDVIGVGVGPGSFTGLRIGVTTARTLAHTLGRPLIGVSSLAALARPAALWLAEQDEKTLIVASTDACKGELFALWGAARAVSDCVSMAEGDHAGLWKRGVEERVITPPELIKALRKKLTSKMSWIAIGEGRHRYEDYWKELPARQELKPRTPFIDQVQGRYVGMLAWEAFQAGLTREALSVHPRYVRASDAELKLKAGLLPKGPTRS